MASLPCVTSIVSVTKRGSDGAAGRSGALSSAGTPARQGRERLEQCILHAAALGAAAVEQLQTALSEQALAVLIELLVVDLRGALFVAPAAHAVGLRRAHLLEQTGRSAQSRLSLRMERMESIRFVFSLSTYSGRNRPPRVTGSRNSSPSSCAAGSATARRRGVAVVDDRRDEADALALAALADRRAEVHAVERSMAADRLSMSG